ncbi:biotin/lipoyl-containing protein [Lentimicrobium sp.]|jgi:biotin carboxyl carrier protein|uniref:biotin/lipoyl-containing protein n=1 Tax=Lentimicrobium sp. TaxID=2034841 RepID=UPI0025DAC7BA|nr:biotin/lipoyl-containing protein [Lentimicrobium sp.]MCO5256383.1 biotin/lipoyl-binding protein [Lentimicrobium sp.]MCO5262390.1 biotin/lipoyl-binding protein [Lentimicrobium sp.]HOP13481.1 biotin/lipoyl-binding protein [Lentimicrobium sp.]HPF64161.1 biotin/lipoyl-binding protein [Lentimicrobium sp.]HPJ61990.1 biotin/lipoyl-binding protein [Lentimicrobium sp.]
MKKFKFTINGNVYEVDIQNIEDNIAEIEVNGTTYRVEVEKAIQTSKTPKLMRSVSVPSTDSAPSIAKTSSPASPKGTGNVKSPLPGVILDVHVREGDAVKVGQRLITLEAMKMENNINADKEGRIVSLKVHKGDAVMEGDVLIVIGE